MAILRTGRAEGYIEADGQYTVLAWSREVSPDPQPEVLIGSIGNLTLVAAFNQARDAMDGLSTGTEKHAFFKVQTTVTD